MFPLGCCQLYHQAHKTTLNKSFPFQPPPQPIFLSFDSFRFPCQPGGVAIPKALKCLNSLLVLQFLGVPPDTDMFGWLTDCLQ